MEFTLSPTMTFNYILRNVEKITPGNRKSIMKFHLKVFLHNPLIKDILEQDKTPNPLQDPPSNTLNLKKIQDTLFQLTKAVETLKSTPPPKPLVEGQHSEYLQLGPHSQTHHLHILGNCWSQTPKP